MSIGLEIMWYCVVSCCVCLGWFFYDVWYFVLCGCVCFDVVFCVVSLWLFGGCGVFCGVRCRVVGCGEVWWGVVWCGVVWCGVVWCDVVWCGVVWCRVVCCGVMWGEMMRWVEGGCDMVGVSEFRTVLRVRQYESGGECCKKIVSRPGQACCLVPHCTL